MERFTVDLPEEVAEALHASVEAGDYASEGDILVEAVRRWAQRQGKAHRDAAGQDLHTLRSMVDEADEDQEDIPADVVHAELREMIAEYRAASE